jgi:hypothetical protein
MSDRARGYERSVREPSWPIRIATIAILAIGVAITIYALTRPEARRDRAMSGLAVGDTSAVVVDRLDAPPVVCPGQSLDHLRGQFPAGWSAAEQAQAVEWLEERTRERWIYSLSPRTEISCDAVHDGTEIGIGADGRVLWFVPRIGHQSLQLPTELEPGTFREEVDA